MKKLTALLTAGLLCLLLSAASAVPALAQSGKWSTAYYAGWSQGYNNTGLLPAQNIDFGAVTHIMHFALVPRADGSLDDASNSVTAFNSNAIISAAHAAGRKVIITVGGFYTDGSFRSATNSANRTNFVNNLVNLMKSRGYDGIDVDWEPLSSADAAQFVAFITELRAAMDAAVSSPRPLLTAATAWGAPIFAQVKDKFDQINLMTYDLAGAWPGWVTWHNAPLTSGGFTFPSTGNPPPSCEGMVNEFLAAGIPASKLGLGIDFYGYVWSGGSGTPAGGATEPRQSWSTAPTVQANVSYATIMDTYYQPQYYRFDNATGVSYLSIDNTGSANDKFISYDDEATIAAKYNYVKSKGLGGAIIWELGGGYRSNMPAGQKDLLLQAVKKALGTVPVSDLTPPSVSITSPSNGISLTGIVAVTAAASDNIGVSGVQFKVDGTNLGAEVTVAPYTVSLNVAVLTSGTHTISAVARDAAGNTSTSSVTVTVLLGTLDGTAPAVSITSPGANTAVSGTVTLTATASDNVGVTGVQFSVDGANVGSQDAAAPYSVSWNSAQVPDGTHTIAATARDAAGNTRTASVTVTVSNNTSGGSASDLIVYNDALQSPWINSSWNANLLFSNTEQVIEGMNSIKVTTTSAWGGLSLHYGNWGTSSGISPTEYSNYSFKIYAPAAGTQVAVFAENDLGQSFPSFNYGTVAVNQWISVSVPMNQLSPNGQIIHRISVQEVSGSTKTFYVDNMRFGGTSSVPPPSADTTKPTVSLISPANESAVSGIVTVSASASDNKKLAGVQFRLNGANLGSEITSAPFSFSWNTASVANGTHTLSVIARDSSGNTNNASITVTVSNAATPPASTDASVFGDSLRSPWMNTSWNAAVTFGSTEQKQSGTGSIKVVQNAWGALRLHSGSWSNPVSFTNAQYGYLSFAVHGGTTGMSMGICLENDGGSSFPAVKYVWVPANKWVTFSYAMTALNPGNLPVHSLLIQDMTGRTKTFYVDNITLGEKAQSLAKDGTADIVGIDATPRVFGLDQNFPNPFNPATAIRYSLPFNASVRLEVYNAAGQQVSLLVDRVQGAGEHGATFDGASLSSGAYFYRLTAKNIDDPQAKPLVLTKRMILMK